MKYTIYDTETGEIISICAASKLPKKVDSGLGMVEGHFDHDTTYIDHQTKQAVLRQPLGVTLENNVLIGVPSGAQVKISKPGMQVEEIADGTNIELIFHESGVYSIEIESWPFQRKDIMYHAN